MRSVGYRPRVPDTEPRQADVIADHAKRNAGHKPTARPPRTHARHSRLPRYVAHSVRQSPTPRCRTTPTRGFRFPIPPTSPRSKTSRSTRSSRRRRHARSRTMPRRGCRYPAMSTRSRRSTSCSLRPPTSRAASASDSETIVREAAAAVEAAVAPSPARAEPHDPATWLPVPDPDTLLTIPELANGHVPPADSPHAPSGRSLLSQRELAPPHPPRRRHRGRGGADRGRRRHHRRGRPGAGVRGHGRSRRRRAHGPHHRAERRKASCAP